MLMGNGHAWVIYNAATTLEKPTKSKFDGQPCSISNFTIQSVCVGIIIFFFFHMVGFLPPSMFMEVKEGSPFYSTRNFRHIT